MLSARKIAAAMVAALWMQLPGLLAPISSVRRFVSARAWPDRMGSVDEPLGSPKGVPVWIVTLLILFIVAAILILAIRFLVPPGPPPYT
ncbi:MAG: hypothetical protein ABSG92_08890 [Conexivisphaerales archaeon]